MREKRTSRILNDQSYILGLSYNDVTSVGFFLLVLIVTGKVLNIEVGFWALSISAGVLMALIPIRLKFRRKIIRDSLLYLIRNGVLRVSKNTRISKNR